MQRRLELCVQIKYKQRCFFSFSIIILMPLHKKISSQKWTKSHLLKIKSKSNNFQSYQWTMHTLWYFAYVKYAYLLVLIPISWHITMRNMRWLNGSLEMKWKTKNPPIDSNLVCSIPFCLFFSLFHFYKPLGKIKDLASKKKFFYIQQRKKVRTKNWNMNRHKKK